MATTNTNVTKRMPKIELDALIAKLRSPVFNTWQVIGGDVEQACTESEERLTNKAAIESCLDGGGMMGMYGGASGKECETLLDAAAKNGHWTQVYNAVCREISLVYTVTKSKPKAAPKAKAVVAKKAPKPKVTYRQEGGDDGYQYAVRVDGRLYTTGCTRSEAQYHKQCILRDWEAKQQKLAAA